MEFYLDQPLVELPDARFQFPTGWNSTKSGNAGRLALETVSIPNGMEFYLKDISVKPHLMLVSIPNGMEFYKWIWDNPIIGIPFQFPTGWNSTINATSYFCSSGCFNSQRDGILR